MPKPIKLFKKRKARKIHKSRTPHYVKGQKPGTTSTVLMVSNIIDDNTKLPRKTGPYNVWPSITTDKGLISNLLMKQKKQEKCFNLKI